MNDIFDQPGDKLALEDGDTLTPRFDSDGLITAVVCDAKSGDILMLAHMNATALKATLDEGVAHFWSRSRQELWKKGATSGNMQIVREVKIDCDQDAVCLLVDVEGASATCHTGRRSCFYRTIETKGGKHSLIKTGGKPLFDPEVVYEK